MRMTWFMRRLLSNAFSGVNSNCRHWSASEKYLKFIKKILKKENTGKRDSDKRREDDDNKNNSNNCNV